MKYSRSLENFFNSFFGGHFSIGPITVYGHNAMHWGINISTRRWGYICFRLPLPSFNVNKPFWRPLYYYLSPNATPWASTYYIGPEKSQRWQAPIRKFFCGGHNYNPDTTYHIMWFIKNFSIDFGTYSIDKLLNLHSDLKGMDHIKKQEFYEQLKNYIYEDQINI